jgi:hypothetical protein
VSTGCRVQSWSGTRWKLAGHWKRCRGPRARWIGALTVPWMRSSSGMVADGRRPQPHSVATPKPETKRRANSMRRIVPATPSV